jgi:deaminated glutathione amidase
VRNLAIIGCAICFDYDLGISFSDSSSKGVNVIIIPSAFTYETDQAHWEILCRTPAIETQSYIIAPAQTGCHEENGNYRAS